MNHKYTPVNSRLSLARPPVQPPPPPPTSGSASEWPEGLKQFAAACFARCPSGPDKPIMEAQLRKVITDAYNTNTAYSIDWSKMVLPVFMSTNNNGYTSSNNNVRLHDAPKKTKNNKHGEGYKENIGSISRKDRQMRFMREQQAVVGNANAASPAPEVTTDQPLVGRSNVLEKKYLRLTSAPNPDTVRPIHVLERTLELLMTKWKQDQNYAYICDQFKSMRQDLTVQRIRSPFTVKVYEIHARIALEKSDLGEYNQCQAQLKTLYEEGFPGNRLEFLAYRLLYLLHTQNKQEVGDILVELLDDEEAANYEPVQHALKVKTAMMTRNYVALFQLYRTAPLMSGYVMDSFVGRERILALCKLTRSFRPTIPLETISDWLGFESEDACTKWLEELGVAQFVGPKGLSSKESYPVAEGHRQQAFMKIDIKGQI
ncbi:THP3-like protein C2A9.11c [Yarrowia sp. E02]|nr:THP3-like protein C2A9.11c [Yarrowia sp. E02]